MEHNHPRRRRTDTPPVQRAVAVLWPSFLVAGVATVAFFTAFDPQQLAPVAGGGEPLNRLGSYTVGFFLFWLLTLSSSVLTCYFQRPCHAVHQSSVHEQP